MTVFGGCGAAPLRNLFPQLAFHDLTERAGNTQKGAGIVGLESENRIHHKPVENIRNRSRSIA
jgi:hypothetical protein